MIKTLSKNQNWAKLAPVLGIITSILLITFFKPSQALFWALINIPLYLFHQTEEHLWPGGFKEYINRVVNKLPEGEEILTDDKIFWINIILVWLAFLIFGILSFFNIGFGLLIVIFSIMNCLTHIVQGIKQKEWNPGLVMASLQFILSVYAAYFITLNGLTNQFLWWLCSIVFSAIVHILLFKLIMIKKQT
ncbi:MAG: HXXEE domain-containing protein [Caldisericaceae bacterium]|nr:HXXEE domain-containing protein [Caldisericaceae bacterium]